MIGEFEDVVEEFVGGRLSFLVAFRRLSQFLDDLLDAFIGETAALTEDAVVAIDIEDFCVRRIGEPFGDPFAQRAATGFVAVGDERFRDGVVNGGDEAWN